MLFGHPVPEQHSPDATSMPSGKPAFVLVAYPRALKRTRTVSQMTLRQVAMP